MKKFMKKLVKKAEGFTLVELVVVIAILGILAGIAIPAYSGYLEKANKANDDTQIASMNAAISSACAMHGKSVTDITVGNEGNTAIDSNNELTKLVDDDVYATYNEFYGTNNTLDLKYYAGIQWNDTDNVIEGTGTK